VIAVEGDGVAPVHGRLSLLPSHLEVEELHTEFKILVNDCPISGVVEVPYPATLRLGDVFLQLAEIRERRTSAAVDSPEALTLIPRAFDGAITVPNLRRPFQSYGGDGEPGTTPPTALGAGPEGSARAEAGPSLESQGGGGARVQMEYRLEAEIARGGMGRIFEAEDPLLHRQVAVKVSSVGMGRKDMRFAREAEVLALLAHPNIVPVYNLGSDSQGRPFYSMKLVRGRTLEAIIRDLREGDEETRKRFSLDRLLTIFRKVCDALTFAHSKQILHRDLKPANIMVGEFGEVLVMDWGLAKVIGESPALSEPSDGSGVRQEGQWGGDSMGMTLEGDVMGTPQYMSPEQAEGRIADLDQRADIYSLGGILYAILTLRAPVEGDSLDEVLTKVRKGSITPMTAMRLEAVRVGGEMTPRALGSDVPKALRAVTLKAMALSREDRYQSVGALLADIEAYQGGFATGAEKAGFWKQLLLLVRRNKGAFATAAAAALLLCSATAWFITHLRASERMALENEQTARKNAARATANENRAVQEKESARRSAVKAQMALAEAAEQEQNAESALRILNEVPSDLRTPDWKYLRSRLDASDLTVFAPDNSAWISAVPDPLPKSNKLITLQQNGVFSEVDLETGSVRKLFQSEGANCRGLAICKKGTKLASIATHPASGKTKESFADIRSFPSCEKLTRIPLGYLSTELRRISLNFDGSLLLVEGKSKDRDVIQLWETGMGGLLWEVDNLGETGSVAALLGAEFSESTKTVRIFHRKSAINNANAVGDFYEVDAKTGAPTGEYASLPFPFIGAKPVANGYLYASVGEGHSLFSWNSNRIRKLSKPTWQIDFEIPTSHQLLAMSHTGKDQRLITLSASSGSGTVLQFWDATRGRIQRTFPITRVYGGLWILCYHPTANAVVLLKNSRLQVWNLTPPPRVVSPPSYSRIRILDDQPFLLTSTVLSGNRGRVFLQKLGEASPLGATGEADLIGPLVSTNRDATLLACSGSITQPIRFLQRSGSSFQILPVGGDLQNIRPSSLTPNQHPILSPSGGRVWQNGSIYRIPEGDRVTTTRRHGWEPSVEDNDPRSVVVWVASQAVAEIVNKSFSANQNAADHETRFIILWSATTGEILKQVPAPAAYALATSADGRWIAEAGRDKRIRIRDSKTLEVIHDFRAHEGMVTAVEWHASRPYLVSASEDGTAKVWSILEKLYLLREEFPWIPFAPDGISLSPSGATICLKRPGATDGLVFQSTTLADKKK
jgi:serine/threonine protein kinase/WD40 repeat protein